MDIHLEKLELMKKLLDTEDVLVLKSIKKIFKKQNESSNKLSKEQEDDILQGINDFEKGNVVSYESIKKEFKF
jgi:hypothetical protein